MQPTDTALAKPNGTPSLLRSTPRVREWRAPETLEETLSELREDGRAALRATSRPALLAQHVIAVTSGGDWPLRAAAMDALLRRCRFGDRDGLVVVVAPARSPIGRYATGRSETTEKAGSARRRTSRREPSAAARPYGDRARGDRPDPGSCDCPDYLRASLGICKHLLCVLDHVFGEPSRVAHASAPTPPRRATLAWDPVRPLRGAGERLLGLEWIDGIAP